MKIVEIFKSVDGEGIRAGAPTIFIRFAGCNLHCDYCDTPYAMDKDEYDHRYDDDELVVADVLKYSVTANHNPNISHIYVNNITITGGEPLLHIDDIIKLLELLNNTECAYSVNIETNGSISPKKFMEKYNTTAFKWCRFNSLFFTFDIKTASAGEFERDVCLSLETDQPKVLDDLEFTPGTTHVMKAVVGSIEDLDYVKGVYNNLTNVNRLKATWFISPVFGKITPKEIVEYILNHPELNDWRVQLQLHKIIWDPDKRGV